jgi:DNA modification methylase
MGEIQGAEILVGDACEMLRTLPAESVHCCVTSPPYWGLRCYGVDGQLGLEKTPEEYVAKMVDVFREVWRVLRPDGNLWLNLGDCYATGAGKVGEHPGGGKQGAKWKGDHSKGRGTPSRADGSRERKYVGPKVQPNRLPIPGLKPKDLVGIPWMVAFALRSDGWWLRNDQIWAKKNPMPESVRDRFTRAHEFVFHLTKSRNYFFDGDATREPHTSFGRPPGNKSRIYLDRDPKHHTGEKRRPDGGKSFHPKGRNRRTVWSIAVRPFKGAHFAVFPEKLAEPCILAGSPRGGLVLDPFAGSGTTGVVALKHGRDFVGIDLNPKYAEMARARLVGVQTEVPP